MAPEKHGRVVTDRRAAKYDHDEVREATCGLRECKAKPMRVERGKRSGERAGDMDRELTGAPALAGRKTGRRGLYLGRRHVRAVWRDGAGGCCGASAASRSDGAARW
jgi:hypothetical protein